MVDPDLVLRKLSALDEYLTQVSEYRDTSAEQYRAEWKTQRIIERTLQMAIEVCADIASHVIADRRLRVPATYGETFEVLGEAGLLDPMLTNVMIRMAKFGNVVVHDYAKVDPVMVVGILRDQLDDLARFRDAVLRWIQV